MKSLQECIDFIQGEIDLAHNDEVPETAAGLEATLDHLLQLESMS